MTKDFSSVSSLRMDGSESGILRIVIVFLVCYFYDMRLRGVYFLSIFLCVLFLFKPISVFCFILFLVFRSLDGD